MSRNSSHCNVQLKHLLHLYIYVILNRRKTDYEVRYFVRNKNNIITYLKWNLNNNNKRRNIILPD